jgi:hypothetical protein
MNLLAARQATFQFVIIRCAQFALERSIRNDRNMDPLYQLYDNL